MSYLEATLSRLFGGGNTLKIQANGAAVIAGLVQAAQRAHKEQGAYIALQFSTAKLLFVQATPVASSDIDITLPVVPLKDLRFVPGDMTMQIVGTVHTHYANVTAMDKAVPGGRMHYSIRPGVSDKDRKSAKNEKFVVYAVDAKNVHKALPNGQARNNLARSLDIIIDALESFGRA